MKDEHVQTIAMCCPKLESFCLNGCKNIYGTTFEELLRRCNKLTTLLLRYTPIRDSCFDTGLWAQTNLEEIDISACTHLTRTGKCQIAHVIRKLGVNDGGYLRQGYNTFLFSFATFSVCRMIHSVLFHILPSTSLRTIHVQF